jgi:N-acetylglucosaminyl-diphospho-decaprenol L-rhamnosyltransferase
VVVVAYRSPGELRECLESFEHHRPERVREVIVIDNSPPAEQGWPATEFPWIDYVPNRENVHFRRGVNQGVRRSSGRYVLLLNPDAYLTNSRSLALLAEVLDRQPTVGFVGPKIRGDDGGLAPQGERMAGLLFLLAAKTYVNVLWPGNPIVRRQLRPEDPRERSGPAETLTAAVLLCRREPFLRVGGFDERARAYWEEHELARKFARLGLHGFYRADAFVFHHWRKGGTEHEPRPVMQRHFEEAMRLYYRESYGALGGLLYDLLEGLQRIARPLVGAIRRAQSGRASTT